MACRSDQAKLRISGISTAERQFNCLLMTCESLRITTAASRFALAAAGPPPGQRNKHTFQISKSHMHVTIYRACSQKRYLAEEADSHEPENLTKDQLVNRLPRFLQEVSCSPPYHKLMQPAMASSASMSSACAANYYLIALCMLISPAKYMAESETHYSKRTLHSICGAL